MDRRLFLPIFILLASVLLLSGFMNFQESSAQQSPDSAPDPVIEDKETVAQNTPKADTEPQTEVSANKSKSTEAPESEPTMMSFGGGGGGIDSQSTESENTGEDEKDLETSSETDDEVDEVKAAFSVETECLNATFTDMSENASSLYWDFGDGTYSELANPEHKYMEEGQYTVNLTAYGDDSQQDSIEQVVTVEECSTAPEEGDEEDGQDDPKDTPSDPVTQEVPEFPTIAIPMVAIIGMAFFFSRRQ